MPVLYECARCHERFEVEAEAHQCPNCKAESGLEHQASSLPFAMRAFGGLLALSLMFALVGTVLGFSDAPPVTDHPHWKNTGVP